MVRHGRKLSLDDVLYNDRRMDSFVFLRWQAGKFKGLNADGNAKRVRKADGEAGLMTICMIIVVAACFGIVCMGLQKGVEKDYQENDASFTGTDGDPGNPFCNTSGAGEGIRFYLLPDF